MHTIKNQAKASATRGVLAPWYNFLEYKLEPYVVAASPHKGAWWYKNFANMLTLGKLPFTFLLSYLLYSATDLGVIIALLIGQALLLVLDGIDGTWARLSDTTSTFGAIADGVADRLMFVGMMLALFLRVEHNQAWPTGSSSFFITCAIAFVMFELIIAWINKRQLQFAGDSFSSSLPAKLRFGAHALFMTYPWLITAQLQQAQAVNGAMAMSALASLACLIFMVEKR